MSDADAPATAGGEAPVGPPPLPPVRADLAHIVVPCTIAWFVAWVVLFFFFREELEANDAGIWISTCLAGWILGLMGLSIYAWQRRAARRGRRSANRMALDEKL